MSSDVAVRVRGVSKLYRIAHEENKHTTLAESMLARLKHPLQRAAREEFWALRGVEFEAKKGDVIGIVGRNGAGKSTLLKILSRITEPTSGKIDLYGRVGSLLEVGTGFHPELTGRENIYLNGAILGMRRSEIARQFDAIVAFSEVEKFLDTPVKRYSSGMYVRLAFAVAAHLDPDILIVDEVLAVGDAAFQQKCLGKMKELRDNNGRTVFLVSHNMNVIKSLCSHVLLLKAGQTQAMGPMQEVVKLYEEHPDVKGNAFWSNPLTAPPEYAQIESIELRSAATGLRSAVFASTEAIDVHFTVKVVRNHPAMKIGMEVMKDGQVVFRSETTDAESRRPELRPGRQTLRCRIPAPFLHFGNYGIRPLLSLHCVKSLLKAPDSVLSFAVQLDTTVSSFHHVLNEENHPGVVFPLLDWSLAEEPAAALAV